MEMPSRPIVFNFINDLPNGKDTSAFRTEDASGSTSQAANVVEAMEAGAETFLIDEDTSATNFMIRQLLHIAHIDRIAVDGDAVASHCL